MKYLALAAIALIIILFTAVSTAANRAVVAVADHAARSPSSVDMIMRSRETAVAAPNNNTGLLIFALLLILAAVAIALFHFGGRTLREWRLVTKKGQHGRHQPAPIPALPYYSDADNAHALAAPRRLPQLPVYEVDHD